MSIKSIKKQLLSERIVLSDDIGYLSHHYPENNAGRLPATRNNNHVLRIHQFTGNRRTDRKSYVDLIDK
ncbi:hypothetical protein [Xenorhabdus mauleonii]|nr:hypothetical protein [Xenorhabdus mauleonii]